MRPKAGRSIGEKIGKESDSMKAMLEGDRGEEVDLCLTLGRVPLVAAMCQG